MGGRGDGEGSHLALALQHGRAVPERLLELAHLDTLGNQVCGPGAVGSHRARALPAARRPARAAIWPRRKRRAVVQGREQRRSDLRAARHDEGTPVEVYRAR